VDNVTKERRRMFCIIVGEKLYTDVGNGYKFRNIFHHTDGMQCSLTSGSITQDMQFTLGGSFFILESHNMYRETTFRKEIGGEVIGWRNMWVCKISLGDPELISKVRRAIDVVTGRKRLRF
jgi:hypothetical protein